MRPSNDDRGRGRLARALGRLRGEQTVVDERRAAIVPASPTVLAAPATGTAVPLAETEDPAFSAGILGPGAAVRPSIEGRACITGRAEHYVDRAQPYWQGFNLEDFTDHRCPEETLK